MITLKTILFSLFIPGTVVGMIPYLILTRLTRLPLFDPGASLYAGIMLIIAGVLIYLTSARFFVAFGKGTPAPIDPPLLLVTTGPYRFVRNPMYCSGILILFGEFVISGSGAILLYLLFIWLIFHLFIVFYEEPHLRKVFGEPYEKFCRKVPRWMPRLRKMQE
jgi:protein-S-isoprenylcysteine O-methyltransferase Ste14